jgi:hypothetical protein
MKAFLISPDHEAGTSVISTVDVRANAQGDADLQHLYELLHCSTIEIIRLGSDRALPGHVLVVDEEGLLKPQPGYLFMPRLHPTPLAGRVIVLGTGESPEGDPVLCAATVLEEEVTRAVGRSYCSLRFARVAFRVREDLIRRACPEAIVVCASEFIRSE